MQEKENLVFGIFSGSILGFLFPGVGVLVVGATVDSSEIPLSNLCIPIDLYISYSTHKALVTYHETLPNINPVQLPNSDYQKKTFKFQNQRFQPFLTFGALPLCFKSIFWAFQDQLRFLLQKILLQKQHTYYSFPLPNLFGVSRSTEFLLHKLLPKTN